MRGIAHGDGIKASSLYSHFRSKAEILRLLVTPFTDDVADAAAAGVREGGTGRARLRAMMAEAVLVVCISRDDRAMSILHYSWPQIRTARTGGTGRRPTPRSSTAGSR